ncbi:ATP-binding protein [bacterium]|nr:ATP-binding protein [bacterium]
MKELVVLSGKGGTGKTSLVASFAAIAGDSILADCDVDAPDLYILLSPKIREREGFIGRKKARIKPGHCTACGKCEELCRFDAIFYDGPGNGKCEKTFRIDEYLCEGCGVCYWFCKEKAIEFKEEVNGQLYVSDTRFGTMVHALLGVVEENSGKLVTKVKEKAREIGNKKKTTLCIVDGSPGIGCPVIASTASANLILIVTEPTLSGIHDMERVLSLGKHFNIPCAICINKWDLNEEISSQIESIAVKNKNKLVGKIRYDKSVIKAQIKKLSVVEYTKSGITDDIKELWNNVRALLS